MAKNSAIGKPAKKSAAAKKPGAGMRGFSVEQSHAYYIYSLQSLWQLKRASLQGMNYRDYFQAGRSVEGIDGIVPAGEVVESFGAALAEQAA